MENIEMFRRLQSGDALSVLKEGTPTGDGMYELRRFVEGKDYCDPTTERWIWSIGKRFKDDKIFAATDARFYNDRNHGCLFLR